MFSRPDATRLVTDLQAVFVPWRWNCLNMIPVYGKDKSLMIAYNFEVAVLAMLDAQCT